MPQNNIKTVKSHIVRLMRMLIEVRWATHCSGMTVSTEARLLQ